MIKRALVMAVPLLSLASAAQAQNSMTLYGSLDAGVGYISNLHGSQSLIAEQGTTQADRWGIKGVEDLGGGIKTVFGLEAGFSTISGAMSSAGVLFNRQSYVGLSDSAVGTLTLGRQTDWNFDMLGQVSTGQVLGDFSAFHPGNIDGLGNTVPVELSSTIKFKSRSFSGLSFGALYGFSDAASSSTGGRSASFGANYEQGPLRLVAVYSAYRDRTLNLASGLGLTSFEGENLAGGAPFIADRVTDAGVGGAYTWGRCQFHALASQVQITRDGQTHDYRTIDGGVNFRLTTAEEIDAGAWTTTLAGQRWSQLTVANVYYLSKLTQLYADVMFEKASSGAVADTIGIGASSGSKQAVVLTGIHHLF